MICPAAPATGCIFSAGSFAGRQVPGLELNYAREEPLCANGATSSNCVDPSIPETRYCSDGNIGEYQYRHDDTGTCLPQTSPLPECVNSYCSGDDNMPDCPPSYTDDIPGQCLDYENLALKCNPGEGALYDSTAVPKTNTQSICCPTGMYARYRPAPLDEYECVSTAPCYDPGNPLLYSCHFDAESKYDGSNPNPAEFTNWLGSTTTDPDAPGDWCVAPAPSSGAAAQACCREVVFGVLDYYNADEDNVIIY